MEGSYGARAELAGSAARLGGSSPWLVGQKRAVGPSEASLSNLPPPLSRTLGQGETPAPMAGGTPLPRGSGTALCQASTGSGGV